MRPFTIRGSRRRDAGVSRLERYAIGGLLVVLFAFFSVTLPQTFFTTGNFGVMIGGQCVTLLLALAMIPVLLGGEFDLSVAAVAVFAGIAYVELTAVMRLPLAVAVIIVLCGTALLAGLHAIVTIRFGVSSLIATLGTATALDGLSLWLSHGESMSGVQPWLVSATSYSVLDVPVIAVGIIVVIGGGIWYVTEQTAVGRRLTFVGEAREVAILAGVRVNRYRAVSFFITSVLSALAGFVLIGQTGSAAPGIDANILLPAFAAAFLGSTTVVPGRFNARGTVLGFYLLVVGVTGIELFGAQSWVNDLFNGGALVVAVTFSRIMTRDRARPRAGSGDPTAAASSVAAEQDVAARSGLSIES